MFKLSANKNNANKIFLFTPTCDTLAQKEHFANDSDPFHHLFVLFAVNFYLLCTQEEASWSHNFNHLHQTTEKKWKMTLIDCGPYSSVC